MEIQALVTILVIIGLLIGLAFMVYLYIRNKTMDQIRADVYKLFLSAEHMFLSGQGKQKMDYVIQMARSLLPTWARFFITEDLLRKIVQLWFDSVKDLLDDGKYNSSVKDAE